MGMNGDNWIKINGESATGSTAADLIKRVEGAVAQKLAAGSYSERDIKYLAALSRPLINQKLEVTAERLEKLRAMCQSWDVDFRPVSVTSHRPVIGKVIVAAKKALQPIIKALLKDTITQQRNFNASVIAAVTDLANEVEKLRTEVKNG